MTDALDRIEQTIIRLEALGDGVLPFHIGVVVLAMGDAKPSIPFDVEPAFDKPVHSFSQAHSDTALRDRYEDVRRWHDLDARIGRLWKRVGK